MKVPRIPSAGIDAVGYYAIIYLFERSDYKQRIEIAQ